MNKFDRVTSILIYLQTRTVVTARELAARFDVSERTVYRDIRTLETAGVPIGSEAGVGYFLEKGFSLPPVMFTRDEAAAMLMGAKLIDSRVDCATQEHYSLAMDKIKSVLEAPDQDFLAAIDENIQVHRAGAVENTAQHDSWLPECRVALARAQVVTITYTTKQQSEPTTRAIEPIGLYYYSHHWHIIAWCRLRADYRDFRLDRIEELTLMPEQYRKRDHRTLQEYLSSRKDEGVLHEIVLLFSTGAARYVGEQKFFFGYVGQTDTDTGVEMTFLTSYLNYFGRWLLQYTNGVKIVKGDALVPVMNGLAAELSNRWGCSS